MSPDYETEDEHPLLAQAVRYSPRSAAPEEEYERNRPPLRLARLPVVLIILAVVVATISWQWPAITDSTNSSAILDRSRKPRSAENPVSATELLGAHSRRSKNGAGAGYGGAGRANAADRGAARRALRGGSERPAGQTLHRLRNLAYGNGLAETWTYP